MTETLLAIDTQPERIREELARILAAPAFSRASRPGRFLTFLVEHALSGEGDKLNEYLLAVEVFNRKPDFDPVSDPIVRVEAGRLRRRLQDYYSADGQADAVRIELPPRTYVPVFHEKTVPAAPASPSRAGVPALKSRNSAMIGASITVVALLSWAVVGSEGKVQAHAVRREIAAPAPPVAARSIILAPFADLSPKRDQRYFCSGLRSELADALSNAKGIQVAAGRPVSFGVPSKPAFVLDGAVRFLGRRLLISVELIDAATARVLWSRTYAPNPKDALAIHDAIARDIVEGFAVRPPANLALRTVSRPD